MKKITEPLVFGLDIGTRSIVGTVGYYKGDSFHVVAMISREHDERVMKDGQIHDIAGVASAIRQVREELEEEMGRTLHDVCIAAAGRVLRTITEHVEEDLGEDVDIDAEMIYSLEMSGLQKAHAQLAKENDLQINFYCVGYTVERYYLNHYQMISLESHKGHYIGADIIATFLPNEVVDGLYKSVNMAGLHVANMTLEPIAAMEVAIPKSFRMLNIALVDVGAGTSDICITKDEAIIAYGMIPSAGDAITEVIAKGCLTHFAEAENIKRATLQDDTINYTDIMGLEQTIEPEEVMKLIAPKVRVMTREIADKIKKLNGGKSVSAVFVVGGGGKVPIFVQFLAEELALPPQRVAIMGEKVMKNIDFQVEGVEKDSLLVTPVGICLNFYNSKNNFIFISFNGEELKMYDNSNLRVSDAAMQSGFDNSDIFPKRGKDITYTINSHLTRRRGEVGEAAVIKLNGRIVSITEKIKAGDDIQVIPSTAGEDATLELGHISEFSDSISVIVNGYTVELPKFASVNGKLESAYYQVKDGDIIEMLKFYTVEQVLSFMDVKLQKDDIIFVNHQEASLSTEVYDNFTVEWTLAQSPFAGTNSGKEGDEAGPESGAGSASGGEIDWNDYRSDDAAESESLNSCTEEAKEAKEAEEEREAGKGGPDNAAAGSGGGDAEKEKPGDFRSITVSANGKSITMSGKNEYVFVDIFNYIDFDLKTPGGKSVITRLNGERAQYTATLKDGDVIDVYWEK